MFAKYVGVTSNLQEARFRNAYASYLRAAIPTKLDKFIRSFNMKLSSFLSIATLLAYSFAVVVWVTEYTTVYVNANGLPAQAPEVNTQQAAPAAPVEEQTPVIAPVPTTAALPLVETPVAAPQVETPAAAPQVETPAAVPQAETTPVAEIQPTVAIPQIETTETAPAPAPIPSSNSPETFPNVGEMTYYDTGLGACGWVSTDSDYIVALSQQVFDKKTPNGNPNNNPYCGKKIEAKWGSKTVIVTVVDSCPGCAPNDLDFSPSAFEAIANKDLGRTEFSWRWIDQV